jgi:hypothetical protein
VSAERNSFQVSVYVDTRLGDRELAAHVAQTLRGSFTGARADIVHAERIDLEVTQNDEHPPSQSVDPGDAFLYFPLVIEFFTEEAFDREALVGDVSAVLSALDQLSVRYVTAADFEDELPRGGRSTT